MTPPDGYRHQDVDFTHLRPDGTRVWVSCDVAWNYTHEWVDVLIVEDDAGVDQYPMLPAHELEHIRQIARHEVETYLERTAPMDTTNPLREARLALGLTVLDLARQAGVNRNTITYYESMHTMERMKLPVLCRIAKALGTSVALQFGKWTIQL